MELFDVFSLMDKIDSSFNLNEEVAFLLEATRDEIYDVYYDEEHGKAKKIRRDIYNSICSMDTTARQDQVGPFAKWILNMWGTNRIEMEELNYYISNPNEFSKDITTFVKLKNVKCPHLPLDLNKYSLSDFKDNMNLARENDWEKSKKELMNSGIKFLYEDQDWKVLVPLTYETEQKYGAGTAWCTAPNKGTYENYTRDGSKLVIIINKKEPITINNGEYSQGNRNPKRKYQILIHNDGYINTNARWECCDANDDHFYYKAEFPENIVKVIDSYALTIEKEFDIKIQDNLVPIFKEIRNAGGKEISNANINFLSWASSDKLSTYSIYINEITLCIIYDKINNDIFQINGYDYFTTVDKYDIGNEVLLRLTKSSKIILINHKTAEPININGITEFYSVKTDSGFFIFNKKYFFNRTYVEEHNISIDNIKFHLIPEEWERIVFTRNYAIINNKFLYNYDTDELTKMSIGVFNSSIKNIIEDIVIFDDFIFSLKQDKIIAKADYDNVKIYYSYLIINDDTLYDCKDEKVIVKDCHNIKSFNRNNWIVYNNIISDLLRRKIVYESDEMINDIIFSSDKDDFVLINKKTIILLLGDNNKIINLDDEYDAEKIYFCNDKIIGITIKNSNILDVISSNSGKLIGKINIPNKDEVYQIHSLVFNSCSIIAFNLFERITTFCVINNNTNKILNVNGSIMFYNRYYACDKFLMFETEPESNQFYIFDTINYKFLQKGPINVKGNILYNDDFVLINTNDKHFVASKYSDDMKELKLPEGHKITGLDSEDKYVNGALSITIQNDESIGGACFIEKNGVFVPLKINDSYILYEGNGFVSINDILDNSIFIAVNFTTGGESIGIVYDKTSNNAYMINKCIDGKLDVLIGRKYVIACAYNDYERITYIAYNSKTKKFEKTKYDSELVNFAENGYSYEDEGKILKVKGYKFNLDTMEGANEMFDDEIYNSLMK